jgi:flagellar biosynthetic protein FliQ
MDAYTAIDLVRSALMLAVMLALPVLAAVFVVAFVASLLQAVTQIQDVTLGYVPRLLIGGATLLALLPWMLQRLATFTVDLYDGISRTL